MYVLFSISVTADFSPMKPSSSSRSPCVKGEAFPAVFLFTIPLLHTLTVSSLPLCMIWVSHPGGVVVTQLTGLLTGLPKPDLIRPSCLWLYSFLSMASRAFFFVLVAFFPGLTEHVTQVFRSQERCIFTYPVKFLDARCYFVVCLLYCHGMRTISRLWVGLAFLQVVPACSL